MTYHTYTTKAVILRSIETGENDVVYVMYTEILGMIIARATGVRFAKSKLRTTLQVGVCVSCTVIRGKSSWKITGAEEVYTPRQVIKKILARLTLFVRKVVVYDVPDKSLFQVLYEVCLFEGLLTDASHARTLEYVSLARCMYRTHMWPHEVAHETLLLAPLTPSVIVTLAPDMRLYVPIIQDIIRNTIM